MIYLFFGSYISIPFENIKSHLYILICNAIYNYIIL